MFVPHLCARMFTTDPTLIDMSVRAIRIMMLVFPFVGYQIVTTNLFQCIGMVKISIFLSLSRQMLFLLPLIGVLPLFWGIGGVWDAMPISDFMATIATFIIMKIYISKLKNSNPVATNNHGQ